MMYKIVILLIMASIGLLLIGWYGNDVYRDYAFKRTYNGMWLYGDNISKSQALKTVMNYDTVGSWICVNIKGMSIQQMVETCEHESSHELFAQACERNITKCQEALNWTK